MLTTDELVREYLCHVDELDDGQMREFQVRSSTVLLIKQNQRFYAYSSKCCHYKVPLVKGILTRNHIRCFAHGACFRVDTGDIEDHPGHGNLIKYDVEIVDHQLFLVARKYELERVERINISEELIVESRPVTVIVGAGAGGFTCADMLRQNGYCGRIVLITREGIFPYDRVQLSKQLDKKPQDLVLRNSSYYDRAKLEILFGTEVMNVNWKRRSLSYRSVSEQLKSLQYDYLVLAMGLRSRRLPSDLPGNDLRNIFYLRTMENANHILNQLNYAKTKNVVIIGDSFIALELCGWFTTVYTEKKNLSILMRSKVPMARVFGERIGRALQKLHEKNGAKFYPQAKILEITGENQTVKFVQLDTGESIPCDVIIVAIGSEPCTEFCRNSPIAMTTDGFIRVNYYLETSIEYVLAVGDISQYPLKVFNLEDVNCQHWQMACSTGHQAAKTILYRYLNQVDENARSANLEFFSIPFFWTTQNKTTTIRFVGYADDPDNVIIHGDLDGDEMKFVAFYIVDECVRAVAQSQYDPLTSEISEIFFQKRNIREEDIENDVYGYKKYLHLNKSIE